MPATPEIDGNGSVPFFDSSSHPARCHRYSQRYLRIDSKFTRDAGIKLKKRVKQHPLVELAHIVILVSPVPVEASGAFPSSLSRWPATGWTSAPGRARRGREHPRLGRFTDRQLVFRELVLAARFRRWPMMMPVMIVEPIPCVQLALLVRFRMVPWNGMNNL